MTSTPIGCTEAIARLWDLLQGDLDPAPRADVDAHLAWCLRCCGELAFARELQGLLRTRTGGELPAEEHARLERFIDDLVDPAERGVSP